MIEGRTGSITQIPILTMPNDDISHPIPDLTGYITEGHIVLGRDLYQKGINPPIDILQSLSRLKIFAAYSKVQDVRALATVLGESDLTEEDKKYLKFGNEFEDKFVNQDSGDNRSMDDTLNLMEELLKILGP